MSINVTVKGNPISINSGKIATSSAVSNDANIEIKKRRQMRLQQVRQQSKDIAQNIRDKVKNEHDKQISQASHDNTTKLKQWQNKKLLQLQNQYQAGLNEIGLGHIQAAEEEKRGDNALVEQEKRKKDTKARGFEAAQKLQISKNEQSMKKALPVQHKKIARDIEDTRAAMESQIKNKIPAKQRKQVIETGDSTPDSNIDLDVEVPDREILDYPADGTPTSDTATHSEEDSVVITTTIKSPRKHKSKDVPHIIDKSIPTKSATQASKSFVQDTAMSQYQEENVLRNPSKGTTEASSRQFYLDTRISDRINNRLLPFPETKKSVCGSGYYFENAPQKSVSCPCPERNVMESASESRNDKPLDLHTHKDPYDVTSKSTIPKSTVPKSTISDKMTMRSIKSQSKSSKRTKDKERNTTSTLSQPVASEKMKGIEVPLKPPVALISSNETLSHLHSLPPQPTNISRVQYYDHRNRYNTEYLTDNANIQKVADENLLRLSDPLDNAIEHTDLSLKRDREAHIRGQKALEKERIHREYNELLQKLPVLQKQERIACICRDKPIFHMNQERLQEVELKRQNVMENAFENLFSNVETHAPKVKVIPDRNNMPFVTIHNPESTSMQLGEDKEKEPQTGIDENQTNLLQILLQNVQEQKEMLQQLGSSSKQESSQNLENKKMARKSTEKPLYECECITVKALILQNTSTQTSPAQTSRTNVDIVGSSPKRPRISISNEVDGSSSPKKAKKIRNKVQIDTEDLEYLLKSTSVPKDKTTKKTSSSSNTDSSSPMTIYKSGNVKLKCDCESHVGCDRLCEIRIRIQENEKPEIIITSPKKSKITGVETHSSKPVLKIHSHNEPSRSALRTSSTSISDRKRSKTADKSTPKRAAINNTPTTWGEHFMQNSASSSTTYYSPPIMQHANSLKPKLAKGLTKTKPATNSTGFSQKQIDRRLMTYISKLLDLSKAQIDEMNISSVSEVTTPNSSVIECPSNRPMKQLMNVMKLFKLSPLDIATNLNYSKDSSPVSSTSRNTSSETNVGYDASKSLQTEPAKSRVQYCDSSVSSKYSSDNSKSTTESGGFITKYTEMTNICHRRISDLTAEIEKIRQEKQQILENHSESDKENSTVYCNLPSQFGQNSNSPISPHSLKEQEKLNKELLQINGPTEYRHIAVNYDDFFKGVDDVDKDIMERYIKLKTDVNKSIVDTPETFEESSHLVPETSAKSQTFSSQFIEEQQQLRNQIIQTTDTSLDSRTAATNATKNVIFNVDNAGRDILDTLTNEPSVVNELTVEVPEQSINDLEIGTETRQDLFFVPLLGDIPRLPKFGTTHVFDVGKRPPPSKGLIAARKFKGDIIAPPHELSTIAEADSLISAKLILPQTPDGSYVEDAKISMAQTISSSKSSSYSNSSEDSMPDILAKLIGKVNVTDDFKEDITKRSDTDTSTEKSDLETIENMLRSIGMDWAIATLRKTRDTLGRNSSSSSLAELSVKQSDCQNNGCISISDSTVGSGSQHSCRSGCSTFGKEFDISQISGGTSNTIDQCNRTSTPVSKRKCTSKKKDAIITDDSDLPSVPETTDDQYLTIPDVSLKSHNRTE